MPKTRVGIRRSASSSSPYGTSDDSTATARPPTSSTGRSRTAEAPPAPNGSTSRAATHSATARPSSPGSSCPTRALARM